MSTAGAEKQRLSPVLFNALSYQRYGLTRSEIDQLFAHIASLTTELTTAQAQLAEARRERETLWAERREALAQLDVEKAANSTLRQELAKARKRQLPEGCVAVCVECRREARHMALVNCCTSGTCPLRPTPKDSPVSARQEQT